MKRPTIFQNEQTYYYVIYFQVNLQTLVLIKISIQIFFQLDKITLSYYLERLTSDIDKYKTNAEMRKGMTSRK